MAIKSQQIKSRIKNIANSGDSSKVVLAGFRSAEEVKEYLGVVENKVSDFARRMKILRDMYLKFSLKARIAKKPWKRSTTTAMPIKRSGLNFTADSESVKVDDVNRPVKVIPSSRGPNKSEMKQVDINLSKPDLDKLKKNSMEIADMYDQLATLDSVIAQLSIGAIEGTSSSAPSTKKLISDAKKLYARTQAEIDKAEKFLSSVAAKVAPAIFVDTVEAVINGVLDKYVGAYEDTFEKLYLTTVEKSAPGSKIKKYDLKLVHYLCLEDIEDEAGARSDAYLIFIGIIDTDQMLMSLYVTFANSFVPPNKVSFGKHFFSTREQGISKSIALLTTNMFDSEIERQPLPELPDKIKRLLNKHPWIGSISKIDIKDEVVTVHYKTDVSQKRANELEKIIASDIGNILMAAVPGKIKPRLRYRTFKQGRKVYSEFYMSIPSPAPESERLDALMAEKLRALFPFTDAEVRQIVRMKNH